MIQTITPCLWFDNQAEEAARFYTGIFPNSGIDGITYYGKEGFEHHGQADGTVLTVSFRINGQPFTAMNGGPVFQFSEAISFQVPCETQEEIDSYWAKLTQDGQEIQCGWLKDKYGVSWQIYPTKLMEWLLDPLRAQRVTKAYMDMVKFDIGILEAAAKLD
jgi:predicted 3-demethylubiquinone-9 3-methyltransferase (glyoxalase superfamily)